MPNSTILGAGLFALLILGLITSGIWKHENSNVIPIRRICEAENVTDVQMRECTVRLRMQSAVEARLDQR